MHNSILLEKHDCMYMYNTKSEKFYKVNAKKHFIHTHTCTCMIVYIYMYTCTYIIIYMYLRTRTCIYTLTPGRGLGLSVWGEFSTRGSAGGGVPHNGCYLLSSEKWQRLLPAPLWERGEPINGLTDLVATLYTSFTLSWHRTLH